MNNPSTADQDFEQFVCAACHNLREALRGLRVRAERDGHGEIESQIQAMESILSGMVEYSLACVCESKASPVEINAVLLQALSALDAQIQASQAVVTFDRLPVVAGDAGQLVSVLRHLIENAIKFAGSDPPRIHVSAKEEARRWIISVGDNGPGIEPLYRERVFIPFKRLHGRNYPGNGLGLAICRKLLERSSGKIWIEQNAILFTLPAASALPKQSA